MNADSPPLVILADDEVFMLRLLEATFKKGGFVSRLCRDGHEAMSAVAASHPQLIVMATKIVTGHNGYFYLTDHSFNQ